MQVYRKMQGRWTRLGTIAGVGLLIVVGALYAWNELPVSPRWLRMGLPLALILGFSYVLLRVVNSKRPADFMIATEGEMKKVSWSSKKEIIGSTKVVIVTALLMGIVLFLVDLFFLRFMQFIKVQKF